MNEKRFNVLLLICRWCKYEKKGDFYLDSGEMRSEDHMFDDRAVADYHSVCEYFV